MRLAPRGLYGRVALIVCLILTATVVSYGWVTSAQQGERIEAELRREAATVVETIAETTVHHLVVRDYASLEELVLEVAKLHDVRRIQLVEPDGSGLVDVVHEPGGAPQSVAGRFRIEPPAEPRPLVQDGGKRVVLWHPIVAGTTIGWVRMTVDLSEVGEARAEIWRSSLILGVLWIAGSSTLLLLLLQPTAAGIRRLADFARTLRERTGERIAVGGGPAEVLELGAALNDASSELLARERELVAERERLEVTLRSIGEAVFVTDTAGATILMNRVAEELTGRPSAEALGRPIAEICRLAPERGGPPLEHPAAAVLRLGGTVATPEQTVLLPREGAPRNVVGNSARILDAQGRLFGTVTVVRDVTERTSLERQLRQAQKMEAVGQLAGGIAHDFNNLLTAIIGYGTILQMQTPAENPIRGHVTQILDAAERAAGLTQSLLTFSRKQVMALRADNLNAVVLGIEKIMRRLIREDVALSIRACGGALPVTVDRGQIEQVLLNLITNARDAMPHGGQIVVETAALPPDDGDGRGWAAIIVSDTGVGMSPEVREKIFDPFFTTKEAGKGTGLGLPMAYGIVSQHHGRITVESEPGAGTTFRVLLPLGPPADAAAKASAPAPPRGGSETILLVEDDVAVRTVTRTILETAGYTVLAAADGDDGYRLFSRAGRRVDLLVSDVVMPHSGGGELLERLRSLRPGLPALFVSGYAADEATRAYLREAGAPLLGKPVRPEALLRAVRELLDAAALRS